jgi:hypothetical protein
MNTGSAKREVPGISFLFAFYVILTSSFNANPDNSSPASTALYETIALQDSSVFATIYTCNPARNNAFLSEDFEFYHDKTGIITSKKEFMEVLEKNYCNGGSELRTRRELVEGSMRVYPLNNAGKAYGAVQTGEHRFYESTGSRNERLSGTAKFTHVWLHQNNEWKLSRVISYDHRSVK